MPRDIGEHRGCAGRAILPERNADRACHFRRSARLELVQFDTHRTRQIAGAMPTNPRLSGGGSFSVESDLVARHAVI